MCTRGERDLRHGPSGSDQADDQADDQAERVCLPLQTHAALRCDHGQRGQSELRARSERGQSELRASSERGQREVRASSERAQSELRASSALGASGRAAAPRPPRSELELSEPRRAGALQQLVRVRVRVRVSAAAAG